MTTQETISKLEGLLARIQRNARGPRTVGTPPVVAAAPAIATQPLPPPVAFASPASLPAAPPPPMAAPAAAPFPASSRSAADQSVDELLSPAVEQSVDIDVPLDTIPPVAESRPREAEPIPLGPATAEPPAPPPPEDAFSLESEVSEVRFAGGPRDSGVEVTVAAIEAEAETIGAEELSEADLVELTESQPPAAVSADVDIDFDDEDEQPPASSQRSRVASSMDEALAAAAQHDAEHEVPIKTPPPESGPQEAPLVATSASPSADVDALLSQELEIPTRAEVGPTAEQLGQTIDLDEARGPSLELAEPAQSSPPAGRAEDLEVALPSREVVGGYDEGLLPPPEAREDLEAHRRRQESEIAPPPESLAQLPSMQPGLAPEIVPIQAASTRVEPEVTLRPAVDGAPESFISTREAFRPASFVELLDASLSLGA